jgi:hypothetical protein
VRTVEREFCSFFSLSNVDRSVHFLNVNHWIKSRHKMSKYEFLKEFEIKAEEGEEGRIVCRALPSRFD